MLVQMKTVARGPEFSADPGDRVEVDAETAAALVAGGHAELVPDELVDDAAASPAARRETATRGPRAKRAKR